MKLKFLIPWKWRAYFEWKRFGGKMDRDYKDFEKKITQSKPQKIGEQK